MSEKNVLKDSNRVSSAVAGAGIRKLLDPKAAAEILGVTPETLAVWRSTRRYALRYTRIGRKIFYRPQDLEAFIEIRSATGTNETTATAATKPSAQRPNKSRVA